MGLDFSDPLNEEDVDEIDFENMDKTLSEMVDQYEKKLVLKSLETYNYHKTKVARSLKINRKTLFNKMKRHNLDP